MGYTTRFKGCFTVDPPMSAQQIVAIQRLCAVDKMKDMPPGAPDAWCQWCPTLDGCQIEWDGGEKFYLYDEWINWIARNILAPGTLSGRVEYQGEDLEDRGALVVQPDGKVAKVPWAPSDAAERVFVALSEHAFLDENRDLIIETIREAIKG